MEGSFSMSFGCVCERGWEYGVVKVKRSSASNVLLLHCMAMHLSTWLWKRTLRGCRRGYVEPDMTLESELIESRSGCR